MMNQRVKLGLTAAALVSAGFGLGWVARGRPVVPTGPRPAPPADHASARVVVSVAGVPVLRFEGASVGAALDAGNKQPPSKTLADGVQPDPKNPRFGTVSARIDINEAFRSGGVSSSPHYYEEPVQLVLVRGDRDGIDWALTPEAAAAIHRVKN